MSFRFLLDWKLWKSNIQHNLLRMFIGSNFNDALSFCLLSGLALGFINKAIGFTDAFTYGVFSVAMVYVFFEKTRLFSNWLQLRFYSKKKQESVLL